MSDMPPADDPPPVVFLATNASTRHLRDNGNHSF
jgi:hypothetical protein